MIIKIYTLYKLDKHGRSKYVAKFASRHRMRAAMVPWETYHFEVEEKQDEYNSGGLIFKR
jgi:hypothetical protein